MRGNAAWEAHIAMWFVGLLAGAFIGSLGDVPGAIIGAIVGAVVGLAWSQARRQHGDDRIGQLEDELARVQGRLNAIEQQLGRAPADAAMAATTPPRSAAEDLAAPGALDIDSSLPGREETLWSSQTAERQVEMPAIDLAGAHAVGGSPAAAAVPIAASIERTPFSAPAQGQTSRLWRSLTGGNPFVRVGIVVLFFGVAFLLKYAAEHVRFPIELRLASAAAGAIALLGVGWHLRVRRSGYALVLQGGAIGILFLTVFAAYRLYALLPAAMTFALLIAFAGFCALLAIVQNSRALALAGVSGGFLAPILASSGSGNHVMLFSYYGVLNLAILAIAWFRAWRLLNVVGFAFTFIIGALWGARFYRPELFGSTESFLIAFFLFYVGIAVLYARRQAPELKNYVDGTIVFGTPLVAFLLQARLASGFEFGSAYSAVGASLFYLALASALYRRRQESMRLLVESFLALGIAFATVAVPLAFDARVTAASWALEGAAIMWVGVRQDRKLGQVVGAVLQIAAGAAFLWPRSLGAAAIPVLNSACLGALMISLGGLYCARTLSRIALDSTDWRDGMGWLLFVWGITWWCGGGLLEIDRFAPSRFHGHAMLLFLLLTCCLFSLIHRPLAWKAARYVAYAGLPVMVLFGLAELSDSRHPFQDLGFVAWPFAAAVHFWLLWRHEEQMPARGYHAVGLWLLSAIAAWELGWTIRDLVQGTAVWRAIGWAIVPAVVLWVLAMRAERIRWPVARHLEAYLGLGAAPIALFVWGWTIVVNFVSDADPAPLPYVPLLNPLDLAQIGAFFGVAAWILALRRTAVASARLARTDRLYPLAAATVFLWLNAVLLRTLHHFAAVPFGAGMMSSMLVQASLSIFWTLIALCAMVVATRHAMRGPWMAGAGLMCVVIGKLFFVDLANAGSIERIVSFLGVGVLLLVVGYFSPVPPKEAR